MAQHRELGLSLYDVHSDGSGCSYSSRLRPILNMRPKYRAWRLHDAPRHFAADLYLVAWLEARGFAYDVITDEDLDREGVGLLARYSAVLTGSHPEYYTEAMHVGVQEYLTGGGRLMYLGGNGFYWVTSVDPERPHVIELRRGISGTRAWESLPGEWFHSTTGEFGGLWRLRGWAPQRLVGVGFAAQGWGGAAGYRRLPASQDPRVGFIFDGIADDEVIGDFGLVLDGAAGDEVDRFDARLGSPHDARLVATSAGLHSDYYQVTVEDVPIMVPGQGGTESPNVRADMVFFATPNGGAVFSVGSINWLGSLGWNGYANNVSRVTQNVLRRFLDPGPFGDGLALGPGSTTTPDDPGRGLYKHLKSALRWPTPRPARCCAHGTISRTDPEEASWRSLRRSRQPGSRGWRLERLACGDNCSRLSRTWRPQPALSSARSTWPARAARRTRSPM